MAVPLEELDEKIEALALELEKEGINTIDYIVARMGWDDNLFMQAVGIFTAKMATACIASDCTYGETLMACYTNGMLHGIIALLDREEA